MGEFGSVNIVVQGESPVEVELVAEQVPLEEVLVGIDTDGYTVIVNGQEPVEDQKVIDGDMITLLGVRIAGG